MRAFGKLLLYFTTSVAVMVSSFVIGYNYISDEHEKGLPTVTVIELQENEIANTITGEASIEGSSKANIPYPTQREILEILVSEGDIVKEGDALVQLDTTQLEEAHRTATEQYKQLVASKDDIENTFREERDAAQQTLESTKTTLSYQQQTLLELQEKLNSSNTESFDALAEELNTKLIQAEIKHSQGMDLYNQGLLTTNELSELQQAVELAKFEYESHLNNYSNSGLSTGERTLIEQQIFNVEQEIADTQISIELAEKKLAAAQKALDNIPAAIASKEEQIKEFETHLSDLELQIEESTIKAPISGRVSDINTDELTTMKGLMNIETSNELVAKILTDKRQANMIGIGQNVSIQRNNNSHKVLGTILNMEDTIQDQVKLTIKLPQNSGFKVGTKENIEVILEEKGGVFTVPETVLESTGFGGTILTVTPDKTLKEVSVRTGIKQQGMVEISGVGLYEGLQIVTEPSEYEAGNRVNAKVSKDLRK